MKLPRWLVIGMLAMSAVVVLVTAGWWWVTWPERTTIRFIELIADGKENESLQMLQSDEFSEYTLSWVTTSIHNHGWHRAAIEPFPRGFWGVLKAEQMFVVPDRICLNTERGRVCVIWVNPSLED